MVPEMTKSAFSLYKHLMRLSQKLPEPTRPYYQNHIRQGFKQHGDETDPERIQQIVEKALKDADWVINKYTKRL